MQIRQLSLDQESEASIIEFRYLAQGTSITKFPFRIHNTLDKKGEIKMERMNFFGGNNKSKENTKSKKKEHSKEFKELAVNLASKIGAIKAAEELGVSTSSIYSWQKTFGIPNLAKSSASIQDEEGNLTFTLEGKTYSLNINSEEERERVKEEVNANSLAKYDWFKEGTGENHWVLYDTEMYEIEHTAVYWKFYLHYKEDSNLVPVIPINATSCRCMFCDCSKLISLDIRNFDTSSVIDMSYMFKNCSKLTSLDFSNFDISNVIDMSYMFKNCSKLTSLDLSNFDTSQVTDMSCMFYHCKNLTDIYVSYKWNTDEVTIFDSIFFDCTKLPNFNEEKTNVEMAKPVEQGGYLILKK